MSSPMRIAIFVEGLTEQEFVVRLISALAGKKNIIFSISEQYRGTLAFVQIRSSGAGTPFAEILVANCHCDNQVKSQIRDQYKSLEGAGYKLILGLRDVYPLAISDLGALQQALGTGLPNGAAHVAMHLAIMEIEAWFLEELEHYRNIDTRLTIADLIASGFDPAKVRAETFPQPAKILRDIYRRAGKGYNKSRTHVERTVNALSYDHLYTDVRAKAQSFHGFLSDLELALFPVS